MITQEEAKDFIRRYREVVIKSSIPGAKIKEIIPVEKKQEATPKQS